jgi:integrase
MASIRKHGAKWQARIQRRNQPPLAKSFHSKADALRWARATESKLDLGEFGPKPTALALRAGIQRYLEEVTPQKKGAPQELSRGRQIARLGLTSKPMDQITPQEIATYRDARLAQVSANTVRLELAFISVVYEQARSEWGIAVANPTRQIRAPRPGRARRRRLLPEEEQALMTACEQSRAAYLPTLVILALETAARFGELVNLSWQNIDLTRRTARLLDTKNGDDRLIPLSERARKAILALPKAKNGRIFTAAYGSIKTAFRVALKAARKNSDGKLLNDFRFHDIRHEAVSRLFEHGLNAFEVALISGHKTMPMLARYTHPLFQTVVGKLAHPRPADDRPGL